MYQVEESANKDAEFNDSLNQINRINNIYNELNQIRSWRWKLVPDIEMFGCDRTRDLLQSLHMEVYALLEKSENADVVSIENSLHEILTDLSENGFEFVKSEQKKDLLKQANQNFDKLEMLLRLLADKHHLGMKKRPDARRAVTN